MSEVEPEFEEECVDNLTLWLLAAALSFMISISMVYVDVHEKMSRCVGSAEVANAGIALDVSSGVVVRDCPVE
ncbi:hypothetical protein D3C85_249320 [compost metagenome]